MCRGVWLGQGQFYSKQPAAADAVLNVWLSSGDTDQYFGYCWAIAIRFSPFLTLPHYQQEGWEWAGEWEGTASGQLAQNYQEQIPSLITSCSAAKKLGVWFFQTHYCLGSDWALVCLWEVRSDANVFASLFIFSHILAENAVHLLDLPWG